MRKIILALAAFSLASCTAVPSTTPAHYADQTKVDEQGAVTAELAYKAWRLAVETGVKSGLIKGALAGRVATLDNKLYSALQTVEAAYAAGNAADIASTVSTFNALLAQSYAEIGGK